MGQPNFLGHFLVLVIPVILYLIFFGAKNKLLKISLLIVLLLHLFCLYFTYSRSAWVAFLLSLFVFAIWRLVAAKKKKIAISLSIVITIIALILIFFSVGRLNDKFAHSDSLFLQRMVASVDIKGGSAQGRLNYWKAGLKEIKKMGPAKLLFGFGPDSLQDVFAKNYKPSWAVSERLIPDRAHNIILDTILQFGFFGFAIGIFLVTFLIKKMMVFLKTSEKNESYYLIVALSFSLFANFIYTLFSFSLTTHAIVLCLFLAITVFFVDQGNKKTIIIKWPLWLKISASAMAVLFLALVTFHYNIKFIAAEDYYFKSKTTNNCSDSWKYLLMASEANKTSIYYKDMLMSKLIECMENAKTRNDMIFIGTKAEHTLNYIKDDKGDFHFLLNKAMMSTILGGENAKYASSTFSALEKDYESIDLIYQYHAYAQIMQKDYDGAISTMKKGLSALPPLDSFKIENTHKDAIKLRMFKFYELIGQAYEAMGEKEKAIPYYEKILSIYPKYYPAQEKIKNILNDINKGKSPDYNNIRKRYEQNLRLPNP
jgi:tetratricopeptide (TPR) repeat protein